MIEIALNHTTKGVHQKDIAENQEISLKYLDQIINALKIARLIRNLKGKKSGYILCEDPREISLLDIYLAFEPSMCIVDCLSGTYPCSRSENCVAQSIYYDLNQMIVNFMKGVSLQDLIDKQETYSHLLSENQSSEISS